jgi:ClpP class serine protease
MSRRIPKRVLAHVLDAPWAITEDGLTTILEIVHRENLDPEAVAAQLGRPLDNTRDVTVRDGVATIPVVGPMFRRADFFTEISGATTYEEIATDVTAALADPKVHAILLAIDSPGGEVTGTSELAQLIRAAHAKKPVTAHVEGFGASAAYWLAAAAGEVVTGDTGILGSIGVRTTITDRREAEAARGTKRYEIVSSQSPAKASDPATEDGRARIQATLDALAGVFIAEVARYRGVTEETVLAQFGQGDVFVGADAVTAGLADRVASYEVVHAQLAARTPASPRSGRAAASHSQETDMPGSDATLLTEATAEQIVAAHPSLATALRAEGATAERERITRILAVPSAGHADLVTEAIADANATAGTVAEKILASEATTRQAVLDAAAKAEAGIKTTAAPSAGGGDDTPTPRAAGRAMAARYHSLSTPTRS